MNYLATDFDIWLINIANYNAYTASTKWAWFRGLIITVELAVSFAHVFRVL